MENFIFCEVSAISRKVWLCEMLSNTRNKSGSRAAAASKMEHFVIIVNGFQALTIITKRSVLVVAVALDPPLRKSFNGDHHNVSASKQFVSQTSKA